jgi:hypothetical protein
MVLIHTVDTQYQGLMDLSHAILCDHVDPTTFARQENHMSTLKHAAVNGAAAWSVAAMLLHGGPALAQSATQDCRPAKVIPLTESEPAAKLVVNAPLPEPLASRGVVVITYCAEHMRIAPVFGSQALAVSPRLGHIQALIRGAADTNTKV